MPEINDIKEILAPIFGRYNIRKAVLFGSYAKGNPSVNSDIDIFVDSGLRGLAFFGLLEDVVTSLNKSVDLIDASQVEENSKVFEEINRTGVVIYGEER